MIKISKMADYATVILAEMAERPDCVMSAAALSEACSLPEPTVSKILKLLTGANLIRSVRGAGGGYKVDQTAENIKVLDIITCVDGPISLVDCVAGDQVDCRLTKTCGLLGRWDGVNQAIIDVLEKITLADMFGQQDCCHHEMSKGVCHGSH